jgi:soluble lytic murein transglycosylase-like protein
VILNFFTKKPGVKEFGIVVTISSYFVAGICSIQAESNMLPQSNGQRLDVKNISGIVSENDASRYRVIFDLQKNGEWRAADKIIRILDDRNVMGHVSAQRYLHPTKYRSRYKELKDWLDTYGDHPYASRIYNLALRRKPKNAKFPKKQFNIEKPKVFASNRSLGRSTYIPQKSLKRADRQERRKLLRQMRYYLRKGWTKSYKNLVKSNRSKRLLHTVERDRAKASLAAGYYADGRDQWAYNWSKQAITRSGKYLPEAHWVAALAAWRLARFDISHIHFLAVSKSIYSSPWLISAGAFWAARASIKIRKPELHNKYLELASAYPRTFYGILARRLLGLAVKFNWASPPLEKQALHQLAAAPGGQRAISLMQIGEDRRAEAELKILFRMAKPELARAMMAIVDRANMPSLAMRIGNFLVASGSSLFDSTTYPAPTLPSKEGGINDRSLILALIRQESRFNPRAKSHRGARGLLQLMPRTASFIARDRKLKGSKKNRDALFDPEKNLSLGQKYINILMSDKAVKGDMFRMLAAWNGGPGNLNKWNRRVKYGGDPLLFIESLPSKETRIFIERVLTNYWIYQARFGNKNISLDLVAQGRWPIYQPLSGSEVELSEDRIEKAVNNDFQNP